MKHRFAIALFTATLVLTGCKKNEAKEPTTAELAPLSDSAATPPPAEAPATPAPTPTLTGAEFDALMGKAVAMFTAMGDAADKSGDDCGKLAASLDKVLADNQPFMAEMRKYKDNEEMNRMAEEWMKVHQAEVMTPMMKVAGAGQKCADHPEFAKVMEKFSEMGN